MAVDRDCLPDEIGQQGDAAGTLCGELKLIGVEPLLTLNSEGSLVSGVTLLADARLTQSAAAAAHFRKQVFDALVRGTRLSVSIMSSGDTRSAPEAVACVCEILRLAAADAGATPGDVDIVVDAGLVSPQDARDLRSELPGDGVAYLPVDAEVMQDDRFWLQLWKMRHGGCVQLYYAAHVVSSCTLLSAEAANAVSPVTGLQVPAGSAWLPLKVDLMMFCDDRGRICEHSLEHTLRRCVELGDQLHRSVRWPTAQMRHDAWLNRRLAILLDGFGSLAQRCKLDPGQFSSLIELGDLLRWMRGILVQQSRTIARNTHNLPALEQCDPSRILPGGRLQEGWSARWRDTLEAASMGHRNLVVMSPWSIFPAGQAADYRYADLLPLLRVTDACALSGAPNLTHWNVSQFKGFHRRTWAVLQQRDAANQIAERT